ncbi:NACHT, LRR and PYD domains-containing protein 12-like [Megalobrama amblycephala]|uniref:NACHT, LRR and PYD domains-containing protein 12-like n=1 Tax=Megalobrama amblycephala TaxID=75352 RepID=UPI002014226F|nr:NACHT, LRR and PYD domains-containing protein 12-like [Megalobrama amblycephala]
MNAEEDTNYHNTCDGKKSVQRERSHSPVPSVLSMKSDKSMKMPIHLKNGESLFDQSSLERSDSPVPSVLSMKSDKSMKMPIHGSLFDQSSLARSHSPDPIVLSLKSDQSRKIPIYLNGGISLFEQRHDAQTPDPEIHQKLKSDMKMKHQYIFEGLAKQRNPTLLNEIYTDLYITEGENGEISNEHEIKRIEKTLKTAEGATIPIKCNDIFRHLPGQDKPIRTVLTKGVAGIGKTVSVQKFILDWAEGKENQDVQLIFPLPFRELNLMKDKILSLSDLLHVFFPETKEMEISSDKNKVLFIFDGLDECRLSLDFQSDVRLCDVSESASVEVLLMNLIAGNLLPSALIWITSRPAAADLVPSECVHRVTEVRGFNEPQKEEYFRKRISDQSLANTIISHLKSSRSLDIMCHIPVFCWISATVLEKMLSEAESGEIPKTLTQMYTHFLMAQISIKNTKYTEKEDKDKEMIFKLGKLAYEQLERGNVIFYEEDLRECGIDVTEASVYSGLCTQIFREEFGWYQGKVFCFVHLSIQEHLAALYVHLSFHNSGKNVLVEGEVKESEINVTVPIILKCAVNKTLESKNGHLDLFLRFLMGLSMESNQGLLERFFKKRTIIPQGTMETTEYLKEKIKTCCPEKSILLFHCLNELNDQSLNDEIQKYIISGKVEDIRSQELGFALLFIIMTSDEKFDEFELRKYGRSDALLIWLYPVIKLSTKARLHDCNITEVGCIMLSTLLSSKSSVRELDLSHNNLQDSGVEILSVGAKKSCYAAPIMKKWFRINPNDPNNQQEYEAFISLTAGLQDTECRLQSLNLKNCGVTEAGCVFLSSALSLNPSQLKVLDLSWNDIRDSGVKHLCASLEKVQCALEILNTKTDSNLKELSLRNNELQDSGVMLFSVGLHHPRCKLEILRLSCCKFKTEGCGSLTSALRSNTHLRELDLGNNRPGDQGVELLSAVLHDPNCRLKTLRLEKCGITVKSCTALASALSSKTSSLTDLDLSINDLQDSGVKKLCVGLQNPHCRLEKLRLSNCNVTHEGVMVLTEALKSNPNQLQELDLLENDLEESDLNVLSMILDKSS